MIASASKKGRCKLAPYFHLQGVEIAYNIISPSPSYSLCKKIQLNLPQDAKKPRYRCTRANLEDEASAFDIPTHYSVRGVTLSIPKLEANKSILEDETNIEYSIFNGSDYGLAGNMSLNRWSVVRYKQDMFIWLDNDLNTPYEPHGTSEVIRSYVQEPLLRPMQRRKIHLELINREPLNQETKLDS
ncbi:hypothetical protein KJ758_00325 [Patescibacteria group bacterium]|nr:hypothetical protein [Patescibacteria group bacterium]